MSQENVELIQRFTAGDGSDLVRLFRDDRAWAALKDGMSQFVE